MNGKIKQKDIQEFHPHHYENKKEKIKFPFCCIDIVFWSIAKKKKTNKNALFTGDIYQ